MFQRLKKIEEYKGKEPLLNRVELEALLKWKSGYIYAAVSNNGFLDVYKDISGLKFNSNHAKALIKCDSGALMGYKGIDDLTYNAQIFERELALLENEAQAGENPKPISAELLKVQGVINISHHVDCPHCDETMYDDTDREWWHENITDQLPNEADYKSQFEINCKGCGKAFIIDGFVY